MATATLLDLLPNRHAIRRMKREAWTGHYRGLVQSRQDMAYLRRCSLVLPGLKTLFTRDIGHHTSGWFKNPDYERCYHLSLSFYDVETREPAPQNHAVAKEWIVRLYGDHRRYVWAEPPCTPEGKRLEVWHYRLFCDSDWQPILPRGEVYTLDFTEAGWKSFSELHPDTPAEHSMGDPY